MNRLCEILGIKYPIIQGAMAWVSEHRMVAAVSEAGGLGTLATSDNDVEVIRREIRGVKAATDKPFAVNIPMVSVTADAMAQLMIEENVPIVVTAAGNPERFMKMWKDHGIKIISVVATVRQAEKMVAMGADVIVAEGYESGGHVGEMTTMALVPQVVDKVPVPVVAGGGIADGRGIAAAFALGASGVQMGTVFLAAEECMVHPAYKEMVLRAVPTDVVVTGKRINHGVRCLKNPLTEEFGKLEQAELDRDAYLNLGAGTLRRAASLGDVEMGSVMAGQIVGLVNEVRPISQIINDCMEEYRKVRIALPEL